MKIKFTLRRYGDAPAVDLIATVDAGATVGDVAQYLALTDPARTALPPGSMVDGCTLCLVGPPDTPLDASVKVVDSGLRSGAVVRITRTPQTYATGPADAPLAVITVTAGPDRGREFAIHARSVVIGRDMGCDVRLNDALVSRQHARVTIGQHAEITDIGSANGIDVNDSPVTRAAIGPGDIIRLGNSEITIRLLATPVTGLDGASEAFIRPPRVDPRHTGRKILAPEPPVRPHPSRFPFVALLAPMVMGAVLYMVTRSVTSLIFVALSPLMMIGYAVEGAMAGRSAFKKAVAQFRTDLVALEEEATAAAAEEVTARLREHPSLAECKDAIRRRTPLLWARRPDDDGFAELRLGLGEQPARTVIELPDGKQLPRDLLAEVRAAAERYSTVRNVPVVARPADHGALGVGGVRGAMLGVARALVAQAVALHSPAEMVLVAFTSLQSARDWDWLKWLPHTSSPHTPVPARHLASTIETQSALVSALEDLFQQRAAQDAGPLPAVLVLVDDDSATERTRARLVEVAENGRSHGIHVLWLASDITLLPAACRTFVAVGSVPPGIVPPAATVPIGAAPAVGVSAVPGHGPAGAVAPVQGVLGTAGFVHDGQTASPVGLETLDAEEAAALSKRLSPLVDVGAPIDDDSDLPRNVSLLNVTENRLLPEANVIIERWRENDSIVDGPLAADRSARRGRKAGTLRAVIGRTAYGDHVLDLRADGPHALVGGTTGSGKSELLQSWILALASAYSPQRLTFLLVDYKGGSAFKDLRSLPHQVGVVTDLDPHEVRRALVSLYAELRNRERIFARHQVKDLIELEKKGVQGVPPSLVIVVDEFAALVNELPEFVDGMINVAQRGRSLGVHLILATQRPAGVIKDNLRANTNLRVALRTADEADSTDVLGSPQAAFFDLRVPGRAVSKTGPGRLVPFQTGFAGGWTRDEPDPPEINVEELRFGGQVGWEVDDTDSGPTELGPNDIQRLVHAMERARGDAQIRLPDPPWLPPLEKIYNVADPRQVPNRRIDSELVFGIQDLPDDQLQTAIAFMPDRDGNLAVYGTGGSGKTTLLRTIAVVAGFTIHGGSCHVYGLDFGARGLTSLERLPHVGSIVVGTDHERIARLISWLSTLITQRAELFAAVNANTITEYRTSSDKPQVRGMERILLLVDGLPAFRQAYESADRAKIFDAFTAIATDGRRVGIHVLLTADRPGSLPSTLASVVQTRVVLRMADANDYHGMNLPADVIKSTSPPGRGMLEGTELQVAILGTNVDASSQAGYIEELAAQMQRANVSAAPAIKRLPELVSLEELDDPGDGRPVLGRESATLSTLSFPPEDMFVVSGPPLSGRTAALRTIATSLDAWRPGIRLHLLSANPRTSLAALPLWISKAVGAEEVAARANELAADLKDLVAPLAVFIESIGEFTEGEAYMPVTQLLRACGRAGVFVVAEGESGTLFGTAGPLALVKASRYGLALGPDSQDGDRIFRTPFSSRLNRADFPAGRGLFVHGGRTSIVQVGWVKEG